MVEQRLLTPCVVGSSPTGGTNFIMSVSYKQRVLNVCPNAELASEGGNHKVQAPWRMQNVLLGTGTNEKQAWRRAWDRYEELISLVHAVEPEAHLCAIREDRFVVRQSTTSKASLGEGKSRYMAWMSALTTIS